MKPVEFDEEAAEEVREAVAFVGAASDDGGVAFEAALDKAFDLIGKQPKAFSPYGSDCRKYVIRKFGYVIYYEELDDTVWVYAVTHGSREPDYWAHRKRD